MIPIKNFSNMKIEFFKFFYLKSTALFRFKYTALVLHNRLCPVDVQICIAAKRQAECFRNKKYINHVP